MATDNDLVLSLAPKKIVPIQAPVGPNKAFNCRAPQGAVYRSFAVVQNIPTIWLEGVDDPKISAEERRFIILLDYDDLPDRATYCGTGFAGPRALHLYEVPLVLV
jgi:hypothetical protein